MISFNLAKKVDKEYKEAMANPYGNPLGGSTHVKNRDPYQWWDFEFLKTLPPSPPENYILNAESGDPADKWYYLKSQDGSMTTLFRQAALERHHEVQKIVDRYGISFEEATKLTKMYVGYNPRYGGYLVWVSPYFSEGAGWGSEHVISEAWDRFDFHTKRIQKQTPEKIQAILANNLAEYTKRFNVAFDNSDFTLRCVEPKAELEEGRERQGKTHTEINLSPNNREGQYFINRSPMLGTGSQIELNSQGYEKILTQLMGPWFEQVLSERMNTRNVNRQQILEEMISDENLLQKIYSATYSKWQEAFDRGDATAMGIPRPPLFRDKSLKSQSGQVIPTSGKNHPKLYSNQLSLRIEILDALRSGMTDPDVIAESLNSKTSRKKRNLQRIRQNKAPINISPEEISMHLNSINKKMLDESKDLEAVLNETVGAQEIAQTTIAYPDIKTALEMATLFLTNKTRDTATGAALGESEDNINPVFRIPSDFRNVSSQELVALRSAEEARIQGLPPDQRPKKKRQKVTPEQISEDIGEDMPEIAKDPETPEKAPEIIPQQESPSDPVKMSPSEEEEMRNLLSRTIKNLIKIAEELDTDDKPNEAEEVHKVIRKYIERR
jgi:hypothetical protein